MGGRKAGLTIEWNGRFTVALLLGVIILAAGYTAVIEALAPHASNKLIQGWTGDLAQARVSNSSLGKVIVMLSDGGMNITITGNSTSTKLDTFYGVTVPVTPPANSTQLPLLDIWVKTNSPYVAGTVALQLDAGWNVTVIQKTYNTGDWHEEIVLLQLFQLPPENTVTNLILGFKIIKSPMPISMPTVEFSRPSFDYSNPTPRV